MSVKPSSCGTITPPQKKKKINKNYIYIYMALIYLMRPWTSTNAENFKTSRANYISKISSTKLHSDLTIPTWGVSCAHSKRPKSVGLFNIEGYYTQVLHKYAGWGHFWKFWICNLPWKFRNFLHSSRSSDALNKSVPYICL